MCCSKLTTAPFVLTIVLSFLHCLLSFLCKEFVSPLTSSILFNCLLCCNSCYSVSVLINAPDSVFLYTKLACSHIKYCPILGVLSFISPPILGLRGKNVVGPFLPFISLNDSLLDFLLNLLYLTQLGCLMLRVLLSAHFPNLTFVEAVQFPFLL